MQCLADSDCASNACEGEVCQTVSPTKAREESAFWRSLLRCKMSNMFNFLADGSSDDEDDTPKRQIKPVAIPKSKPVPAKANSAPKKDGGNNRDTGRSNNRDRGGRGNGKGNRGKGKGKGGRGGDRERRPRREFDRRSGTGRSGPGAEQRKDGAGKGNWGSDADMMNSASQDQQAVANELEQDGATAEEQEPEEPEEEDNELTLEEYQAQLAAKNTGDAFKTLKARKVDTDFEGAAVLKKGEEEEFLGGKEKNLRKKKTQKKKGTAMELKINFARSDSDGGGGGGKGKGKGKGKGNRGGDRDNFRGGKGGGKGKGYGGKGGNRGGGKGYGKGGNRGGGNLNVNSQEAFPSLG